MAGRTKTPKPVKLSTDVKTWERQPAETEQAWEAFVAYRDLGFKRTVSAALEQLGRGDEYKSTCYRWSIQWSWRMRALAWDVHRDRREREAVLAAAAKKAKQRANFADAMWMSAMRGLSLWNDYLTQFAEEQKERKDRGRPLQKPPIRPESIRRLAETGVKLALLLEGRPTNIEQIDSVSPVERRKEIQRLVVDPAVRRAMRTVAKAAGNPPSDAEAIH